jgi:hypothetical protein
MRALVLLCLVCGPARARAEAATEPSEPPVLASMVAGVGLALGSLAVGGEELATHESQAGRKPGAYTILYGLSLSPIASHAIVGEWGRAALFGTVPLAVAIGATALIESKPSLLVEGGLGSRRLLTLCYTLVLLSSAVGLHDSIQAGERARARVPRVEVAPLLGRGEVGVALGGLL